MHIVEFTTGEFAIRRWQLGWEFLNNKVGDNHWWLNNDGSIQYAAFPTEEAARERAKAYMNRERKYKVKRRIKI